MMLIYFYLPINGTNRIGSKLLNVIASLALKVKLKKVVYVISTFNNSFDCNIIFTMLLIRQLRLLWPFTKLNFWADWKLLRKLTTA